MSNELAFGFLDHLQLMVQDAPIGLTNLLPNPDGTGGAWGWYSTDQNVEIAGDMPGLHVGAIGGGIDVGSGSTAGSALGTFTGALYSIPFPVIAGRYVAAYVDASATAGFYWTIQFDWLDAAGNYLSSSALSPRAAPGSGAGVYVPSVVPTNLGVAQARLHLQGYTNANKPVVALVGTASITINKAIAGQAAAGAPAPTATALTAIPPPTYTNILGDSNTLKIVREGLNVGTLTADCINTSLDPATSTQIRPGRRVQVRAKIADTWQPIYTGTITNGKVTYDLQSSDDTKRAHITLTAVDAAAALSSTPAHEVTNDPAYLPNYPLRLAGVPWNIADSTEFVGPAGVSYPYIAHNENSSALDQVAIVRDTWTGFAWVSRNGVVTFKKNPSTDGEFGASFNLTESDYTPDIGTDFDTDRCINTVNVTVIGATLDGSDTQYDALQTPFGPYMDAASRREWGEHSATVTIADPTLGTPTGYPYDTPEGYAAALMAANATPVRRVLAATVPIRTTDELEAHAGRELYDLAHVTNPLVNIDQSARVESITHTITATKRGGQWVQDLTFMSPDSVPAPTAQPSFITAPQATGSDGWQPLDMGAFMTNYGSPYPPASYRVIDGVVYVRGLVVATTAPVGGSIIVSGLPAPPYVYINSILNRDVGVVYRFDVNTSGQVTYGAANPAFVANQWINLNDIRPYPIG